MIRKIKNHLVNIPGWRTRRKIVVFESDDWGMTRMPSKKDYDYFENKGFEVNTCPYNKYDSLESNDDLNALFEVLSKYRDLRKRPPAFTMNNIVANPNYAKIKENNFEEYFYEVFTDTLEKYPGRDDVFTLHQKGIEERLAKPQFHGREHVNINRWLHALKNGDEVVRLAFDRGLYSVHKDGPNSGRREYLDAFGLGYDVAYEVEDIHSILEDGLNIFKELWGFHSKSVIAPCFTWSPIIESTLFKNKVKYIQGNWVQKSPVEGNSLEFSKIRHYLGQKNKYGQTYLVRNVVFEPAEKPYYNWVYPALNQINNAFLWKKPAIVSTHRVNYIGSIDVKNRDNGLKQLDKLLKSIVEKWPEVEFMTSDELGETIKK